MLLADVLKYFSLSSPSQVQWAHRTNSQAALIAALADEHTHFIEADVLRDSDGQVIMAHPPETQSDLTFIDFINQVTGTSNLRPLGIKIDFKDPSAVEECVEVLRERQLAQPIILNADILTGPGGFATRFDAQAFIGQCMLLPSVILSYGWTSKPEPSTEYTPAMIEEMLSLTSHLSQHVTFPIRMMHAKKSFTAIQELIQAPERSLSFWNNEPLASGDLEWFAANFDPQKSFYDIT